MAAAIRLQWWREALETARAGRPRTHDVARGLAEMFAHAGPPLELFEPLLSARAFDASPEGFVHLADLETYGDATAGSLMRIATRLLDEHVPDDLLLRHAGTAYALTGLLRALPAYATRATKFLPQMLTGVAGPHPALVVSKIVERARAHHAAARSMTVPRNMLPALLPASLVPLYAKRLIAAGDEALRRPVDVPLFRRQWAMLRAVMRGSV